MPGSRRNRSRGRSGCGERSEDEGRRKILQDSGRDCSLARLLLPFLKQRVPLAAGFRPRDDAGAPRVHFFAARSACRGRERKLALAAASSSLAPSRNGSSFRIRFLRSPFSRVVVLPAQWENVDASSGKHRSFGMLNIKFTDVILHFILFFLEN